MVGVVAAQHDRVAAPPLAQGVDRLGREVRDPGAAEDRADAGGHRVEPGVAGAGERDLHLGRRHGLGLAHDVHGLLDRDGPVGLDPVDREHHVVGGERGAVAELRPLHEVEGVRLAVGADGPALGERRLDSALLVDLDQALVDVAEQRLRDGRPVRLREVHARGLEHQTDGDVLAARAGLAGGAAARARRGGAGVARRQGEDARGGDGDDRASAEQLGHARLLLTVVLPARLRRCRGCAKSDTARRDV